MIRAIQGVLCKPKLVVGEIAALAVAGTFGAALPGLRVFQSRWFAIICLMAALSLAAVVTNQLRRRRIGSFVLHSGLLLVIVAGAGRAFFASEAVVDLFEGETLAPNAVSWGRQFPGPFAKPFHLDYPVTLETVRGERYQDGSLRDLRVRLSVGEVAVNRQLNLDGNRLSLDQASGPAALIEWSSGKREAVLLDGDRREGRSLSRDGLAAYLRANAMRPSVVEIRVMRGNGLLAVGELRVGETLPLPGGASVTLRSVSVWARLRGSRDPSGGPMYAGFALVLAGAFMIFVLRPLGPVRVVPVPVAALALLCSILSVSCRAPDRDHARQLVLRYNEVVSEAYRRADVKLLDPVVGPNEGKKLTGLIGVRLDFGLTLDSKLLSLDVTGVEQSKDGMRVRTREQWRYCDRRIGTGEQVGEAAIDSYEMLYVLKRLNKAWVVDEIQFASRPRIGRTQPAWLESREVAKP